MDQTKYYETTFILNPLLDKKDLENCAQQFETLIKDNDGVINHSESWGLRTLTYPIRKTKTGFYYTIEFSGAGKLVFDLETSFKREENVLRFLIIALDRHAVKYNNRYRKGGSKEQVEKKLEAEIIK